MSNPEQQPRQELTDAHLLAYMLTFIPRTDLYHRQADNGDYYQVQKPVHIGVVAAHLKGNITIGAYMLSPDNMAKSVVFDADEPAMWHKLMRMASALEDQDIPVYRELSRRGGHLRLFSPAVPGVDIRRFGKQLLREFHISEFKKDVPGVEIYPKQDKLVSGPGSFVRLPLGIHRMTGKRYSFINHDGTPLAPTIREQLKLLIDPKRVSQDFIDDVLSRAPPAKEASPTPPFVPPERPAKRKRGGKDKQSRLPSERIKAQISVLDFVSQYVELDSIGRGYCPFHDDQKKSFQVSSDGNYWNCYAGCGGGSVIDFWMSWRNKHGEDDSFKATITDLANTLLD